MLPRMQGKTKEHWEEFCEQAAAEQDPRKLGELIKEIDRLLCEKRERLENAPNNRRSTKLIQGGERGQNSKTNAIIKTFFLKLFCLR